MIARLVPTLKQSAQWATIVFMASNLAAILLYYLTSITQEMLTSVLVGGMEIRKDWTRINAPVHVLQVTTVQKVVSPQCRFADM